VQSFGRNDRIEGHFAAIGFELSAAEASYQMSNSAGLSHLTQSAA
jgi:hypothetical protein